MAKKKKRGGGNPAARRNLPARPKKQSKKQIESVLGKGALRKRPRQDRLPGVEEDPGEKAIDNAAYKYVEARDLMQAAVKELTKREQALISIIAVKRPGATAYRHTVGGETINVKITAKDPTKKVKVRIQPVEDENEFVAMDRADKGEDAGGNVVAMDAEGTGGDIVEDDAAAGE